MVHAFSKKIQNMSDIRNIVLGSSRKLTGLRGVTANLFIKFQEGFPKFGKYPYIYIYIYIYGDPTIDGSLKE